MTRSLFLLLNYLLCLIICSIELNIQTSSCFSLKSLFQEIIHKHIPMILHIIQKVWYIN